MCQRAGRSQLAGRGRANEGQGTKTYPRRESNSQSPDPWSGAPACMCDLLPGTNECRPRSPRIHSPMCFPQGPLCSRAGDLQTERKGSGLKVREPKLTHGENRTLNLLIRGQAPCPLGHAGCADSSSTQAQATYTTGVTDAPLKDRRFRIGPEERPEHRPAARARPPRASARAPPRACLHAESQNSAPHQPPRPPPQALAARPPCCSQHPFRRASLLFTRYPLRDAAQHATRGQSKAGAVGAAVTRRSFRPTGAHTPL